MAKQVDDREGWGYLPQLPHRSSLAGFCFAHYRLTVGVEICILGSGCCRDLGSGNREENTLTPEKEVDMISHAKTIRLRYNDGGGGKETDDRHFHPRKH